MDAGERIVLFAPNSPDWILADLAIQSPRAVTGPLPAPAGADTDMEAFRSLGRRYAGSVPARLRLERAAG